MSKTAKKTTKKPYKAVLHVLGKKHKGEGTTVEKAIENIDPGNCKGKAILQIEKDGKQIERIFAPALTFRIFNTTGLTKDIALKQVSLLFKGL